MIEIVIACMIFVLGISVGMIVKGIEVNVNMSPKEKVKKDKNLPLPGVTHLTPERESNFAKIRQEDEEF